MLVTIQAARDNCEIDETASELKLTIKHLSKFLMTNELNLVEQFEDVIKEYEANYGLLCASAIESARTRYV
jgi:hypothetical protein